MPELQGELPQDKEMMLSVINRFLALDKDEQMNFIFGRRERYYGRLDDMQDASRHDMVQKAMGRYHPEQLEALFHDHRKNWI